MSEILLYFTKAIGKFDKLGKFAIRTEKITLVLSGDGVAKENEQKGQRVKPTKKDERLEMLGKASDQAYQKYKV